MFYIFNFDVHQFEIRTISFRIIKIYVLGIIIVHDDTLYIGGYLSI